MRSSRFAVPAGIAAAIALGAWVPTITAAGAATPDLPAISAADLLAKAEQAKVAGLSGTVRWTANLGLPDISGLTSGAGQDASHGGFDPTTLLSGSHDISVWDDGVSKQRLALPGTLQEVDVVHNGKDLWYFDSSTDQVTHYVPGTTSTKSGMPARTDGDSSDQSTPDLTPDQLAQELLAEITPSTEVSVASPIYVANRPTYELVLQPKAASSTVGSVTIAIDSATGFPMQVQVIAKGSTKPALSLGYSAVSFTVPAASNFDPPSGTTTVTKTLGGEVSRPHAGMLGSGARAPKHSGHRSDTYVPGSPSATGIPAARTKATVVGTDWGSILTLASVDLGRAAGQVNAISTPVSGSFGSARLVQTSLVNLLLLPSGKVLAGFVTPATLEAAAGSAG